jgi:hypothetical protein
MSYEDFDREIRVQIPDNTIPTRVVFELPDGEQWGTGSGSFDGVYGKGHFQLVQLPNRREELRAALTAAAKAHREAQDEVTDALDRLEETNKRLMAAARAVRNYTTEERAE